MFPGVPTFALVQVLALPALALGIFLGSLQSGTLFLAVVAFLGIVVLIVRREIRRNRSLSVLVGVSVYYALAFPIGALFVGFTEENAGVFTYDSLLFAVLVALGGLLLLYAGYSLVPARLREGVQASTAHLFDLRRLTTFRLLLLFAVGWAARAVLLSTGHYSRLTQAQSTSLGAAGFFINILALLPQYVIFYRLITRQRGSSTASIVALIAIEVVWALGSAARANFVGLAVGVVVSLYLAGRKLPTKTIALSALASVFIVFPLLNTYRTVQVDRSEAQQQAIESISADRSFLQQGYEAALSRAATVISTAAWYDTGRPQIIDYPGSRIMQLAVVDVVPRALFPDKPNSFLFGNAFGRSVGLLGPSDNYTSISVSPPLQGYLIGGFLGLLLVMPLVGFALAVFDAGLFRTDSPLLGAAFATLAFKAYYSQETILSAGTYGLFKSAIFLLLIILVAAVRQGTSSRG